MRPICSSTGKKGVPDVERKTERPERRGPTWKGARIGKKKACPKDGNSSERRKERDKERARKKEKGKPFKNGPPIREEKHGCRV